MFENFTHSIELKIKSYFFSLNSEIIFKIKNKPLNTRNSKILMSIQRNRYECEYIIASNNRWMTDWLIGVFHRRYDATRCDPNRTMSTIVSHNRCSNRKCMSFVFEWSFVTNTMITSSRHYKYCKACFSLSLCCPFDFSIIFYPCSQMHMHTQLHYLVFKCLKTEKEKNQTLVYFSGEPEIELMAIYIYINIYYVI